MEIERTLQFIGNHWIMTSGLFILAILLIQDLFDSVMRKHKTVSPTEAVVLMNDDGTLVIDVREPDEFAGGHIEGAHNIPAAKLKERVWEFESHKETPIIVTCQSGTRSLADGIAHLNASVEHEPADHDTEQNEQQNGQEQRDLDCRLAAL
jgi:rhodanese-related sulfurtransferase